MNFSKSMFENFKYSKQPVADAKQPDLLIENCEDKPESEYIPREDFLSYDTMVEIGRALSYNIFGQFIARVISFSINMYMLRIIDKDVLGIVNVRLMLLYNTVLFLTREPMRKANILRSSVPQFVNLIWLSCVFCTVISGVCLSVWVVFSSSTSSLPTTVLLAFPISAIIESFAEPFAIISLRYSLNVHFAISQSLLTLLRSLVAFVFLQFSSQDSDHLFVFAYAQIAASTVYLLFNFVAFYRYCAAKIPELAAFPGFHGLFPQPRHGIDRESLSSIWALFCNSLLKQLLTDGSSYVMTFTEILSLADQAVFDAIERLGSLVARIVLSPVEENCYAEFSNQINRGAEKTADNMKEVVSMFSRVLHLATVLGFTVSFFGPPYSKLAVSIYGGSLLADNGGAMLLSVYSVYLSIMAFNGITECFAMASMNNSQVFSHGRFLFLSAAVHLLLNVVLCNYFNAVGFIIANALNMLFRIGYSWHVIGRFLRDRTPSLLNDVMPTASTLVFLFFSLAATTFSFLLFGGTGGTAHPLAHISIGGVMFLLVLYHIYHSDHIIQQMVVSFHKRHSD